MTELDKFKRRTIRSVARLLRQKKPPDELWSEMKKETGTDCRVLWERMRALCIKKLNRMLAVDDRSDSLPSIARLSLTDWLLVDLVLVHEKIDVIAMEKVDNKAEQKPLVQLFNLVQRFDVEGRSGEALAEAWAAATVFYNRQGRQCSPMLLQRRWYQLKKLTRCRFYKFWQSYRGNTRLLAEARQAMPTRLQMAVAKRYPAVITGTFPEWEELIPQRLIILPEEFESKMRMTNLPKPCNSSDPDLVVVEPVIETIELAGDSDTEEPKGCQSDEISDPEKSNDATPLAAQATQIAEVSGVNVKSEPIEEDGLSNVQVVATTHVPEVEISDDSPELDDESSSQAIKNETRNEEIVAENSPEYDDVICDDGLELDDKSSNAENNKMNTVEKTGKSSSESDDDVIEIPNVIPSIDIDLESPTEVSSEEMIPTSSTVSNTILQNMNVAVEDIIKLKADEFCRKDTEVPAVNKESLAVDDLIKDKVETFLKTPKENINFDEKKPDIDTINTRSETLDLTAVDLMADLNFVDDGIEFIDDGVEFVEENYELNREPVTKASPDRASNEESEDANKFDLKLLMDPVVYTTKLDHMTTFINKLFGSVDNKEDIDKIIIESRPVSKKSFNINIKQEDTASQIDNTSAIDDAGVNDDLFTNQESDSDDEDIEDVTVSANSYMLRKPRTRTYNPIQLCKNPDFNTKLRRLPIGFFSSPRNRQLLNACIPMTIDVSKAFESKLLNGTLYLKSSGTNFNNVIKSEIDNMSSTSVMPSALPMQSLLDKSQTNILDLIPTPRTDLIPTPPIDLIAAPPTDFIPPPPTDLTPSSHTPSTNSNPVVSERKKIINLPDIEKVRKINQQLLTAQVPPLRVYSGNSYRPLPQSVKAVTTNQVEQIKPSEPQPVPLLAQSVSAPSLSSEPSLLPTVVKVESESAIDNKGILTAPEAIIPPEPVAPAKQKLLKIINQAKLLTQEALTKIDMGGKSSVSDGLKQLTLVRETKTNDNANKKYSYGNSRVSVPWTPRFTQRPENIDDFLITGDTLNKMLHLMSGDESEKSCACCSGKQKKADSNKTKKKKEVQTNKDSTKNKQEISSENQGIANLVQHDKGNKKPSQNTGPKPKSVLARGRVVRYCCWARQKICNRKRMTKHSCPLYDCICCCRDELTKFIEEKKKLAPIEVSDDEEKSLKMACESIENVVQQSRLSTPENFRPQENTAPKLVVMRTISTSTDTSRFESNTANNSRNLNQVSLVNELEPPKAPPVITKLVPAADLDSMFRKRKSAPKPTEPLCVPSPCQKPAVTQGSQLSIVIDASKNVTVDAPKTYPQQPPPLAPKENKILYLNSKSISKSPSESPIFLGKNKILLTTVKFPRKEDVDLPQCEVFQAPKIIPTLPLPNGVQLVLLPSGSVTYTLDQGVELTAEQLATLPTIIAAVQEQLNTTSVPSVAPPNTVENPSITSDGQPVIDVLQPDVTANPQTVEIPAVVNINSNEVFQDKELPQIIKGNVAEGDKQASVAVDAAVPPANTSELEEPRATDTVPNPLIGETNDVVDDIESQKITLASNDNVAISSETQALPESELQAETRNLGTEIGVKNSEGLETNDQDAGNNRKSLLSDLMEMSGISAEDTTAADPKTQPAADVQVPVFATADQAQNLPELSPVTSFAELKYACEQNGKFFKLDFETGIIVPINVCIKKNPKQKPPLQPKAVIDLTDDIDDSNDSTNIQDSEPVPEEPNTFLKTFTQYVYKGKTLNVQSTVKPIKLFKAVRPPSLLKRQCKLDDNEDQPFKKRTHLQNRKQILNKVEAKIDLVDSDAPMEEEYLMDSSDDESSKTENEPMLIEALDELDYSSDDEPLAKKSKRMKETHEAMDKVSPIETNLNEVESDKTDAEPKSSESVNDVRKELTVPMECEDLPGNEKENASEIAVAELQIEPELESQTEPAQPLIEPAHSQIEPAVEPETDLNAETEPDLDPDLDPETEPDLDPDLEPELEPELRFMSDQSDNEDGEDNCILGV